MMDIFELIKKEEKRQQNTIELIASENITSKNIRRACGSVLTNKYAEGYPKKRYYSGCEIVDEIEQRAIDLCKELFKVSFVNVQPHSGSNANEIAYFALLEPKDKILGMSLDSGGHLTHGYKINFSGKNYDAYSYGVNEKGYIDYQVLEKYSNQDVYVIGGASVYKQAIEKATKLEITRINKEYVGDTFFPEIDTDVWTLVNEQKKEGFSFLTYIRK